MRIVLMVLGCLAFWQVSGQDDLVLTNCPEDYVLDNEREVFRLAELMPSWVGCESFDFPAKRDDCTAEFVGAYIGENLVYPERAKEMGLEGEVWIKFIVEENGCLSNIAISRTIGGHTGWEAQKLVRNMPYWNPGQQGGRVVPIEMHIPVRFELP